MNETDSSISLRGQIQGALLMGDPHTPLEPLCRDLKSVSNRLVGAIFLLNLYLGMKLALVLSAYDAAFLPDNWRADPIMIL